MLAVTKQLTLTEMFTYRWSRCLDTWNREWQRKIGRDMSTTVSFSATRYENVEENVTSSKNELSATEPLRGSRRTLEVKLADNCCDVAKLLFLPDTDFKQICADL